LKAREEIKKTRLQRMASEEKALAVLDAKALCFDNNDYKSVSVADFYALLAWYDVPKENKMKKTQMVAWWKEIRSIILNAIFSTCVCGN
jgi:hypothetical protein